MSDHTALREENIRLRGIVDRLCETLKYAEAIINYGNHDIEEWNDLVREIRAALREATEKKTEGPDRRVP